MFNNQTKKLNKNDFVTIFKDYFLDKSLIDNLFGNYLYSI
jgi:hypothetical protein